MDPKEILILEKGPNLIEAIRKFYPAKKMTVANYKNLPTETFGHLSTFPDLTKDETLVYFDELIEKYKLKIRLNAEVFKVVPRDRKISILVGHEEITSDHVGIGIGILGRPKKPTFKLPGKLRKDLLFDITSQPIENCKVLVVGGGDTSSEYCQVLVEENNQVVLCYRGDHFHRMMDSNREKAEKLKADGRLEIRLQTEVKEILEVDGKAKVHFVNNKEYPAENFDKVIFSIGGTTPLNFLRTIGIDCPDNWPKCGEAGETNVPGVYLLGDLVTGKSGGSIILCYNSSYSTAKKVMAQVTAEQTQAAN